MQTQTYKTQYRTIRRAKKILIDKGYEAYIVTGCEENINIVAFSKTRKLVIKVSVMDQKITESAADLIKNASVEYGITCAEYQRWIWIKGDQWIKPEV